MKIACVDKLLKDNETVLMRERRAVDRKPFTRPVTIQSGRDQNESHEAFSRDISPVGICIVSRTEWPARSRAQLTVHTVSFREQIEVTAEVKWTEPFGNGWFLTGWHFVDES